MTLFHNSLNPSDIHHPFSFIFQDSQERLSASVSLSDLWKFSLQVNNQSLWWLISVEPTIWVNILIEGSRTLPSGPAGGALRGSFPNPQINDNSHSHTPGVTIPPYPTSLPPSGPAGGDLQGTFPNPSLNSTGISPGTYTYPSSITFDAKGRAIQVVSGSPPAQNNNNNNTPVNFNNVVLTGSPITPTPPFGTSTNKVANTEFVSHSTQHESLGLSSSLTIQEGFQKVIYGSYEVAGSLFVAGSLIIDDYSSNDLQPDFLPVNTKLTVPLHYQKLISGPYFLNGTLEVYGLFRII